MASALVPGVGRRYGACRSSGAAEYSHRWEHGFSAGTRISAPSWAATDVQARAWGPGKPGPVGGPRGWGGPAWGARETGAPAPPPPSPQSPKRPFGPRENAREE